MGFLNGRVTFTRYRVGGPSPLPFGDEILELARQHLIGQPRLRRGRPTAISTGWAGGDHVLDLTIDLGKNIVNDAAPHGDPDRHRQDPRLAAAGLHPDRDRRPGADEPQRRSRPRPRRKRPRRPPRPAPRPRPPTAGSAASTTTRSSGTARPRRSTPAPPAPASSNGSRSSSARRSTARSSRSPPAAWPGA